MNKANLRVSFSAGLALALCLCLASPAWSQTYGISGYVQNGSTWQDSLEGPPGDGNGQGLLMLGMWVGTTGRFGTPVASTILTNATFLPLPYGPYPYGATVTNDSYVLVAWVDGNTNGLYDLGEPYGEASVQIDGASVMNLTISISDDNDTDKLPDWWESHWFRYSPDPLSQTGTDDPDKDGINNEAEAIFSIRVPGFKYLNPANWDTDGDGMDDGWEVKYFSETYGIGTDPCQSNQTVDIDGDGLSNWQEYCGVDGYAPMTAGLYLNGVYAGQGISYTTDDLNPLDIDTDFDLLIDSFEAAWYDPASGLDPKSGPLTSFPSSTNINTTVAVADPDLDGLSNYREQCLLAEFQEGAANGDKWVWQDRFPFSMLSYFDRGNVQRRICLMSFTGTDINLGLNPATVLSTTANRNALRNHEWTDPTEGTGYLAVSEDIPPGHDTDEDWLPDGWEVEFNLDPRDDGMGGSWDDGPFGDPDGDDLLNIEEYFGQDGYRFATDPSINGTGDETNPYQYNHRPDSTYSWRWYPSNILVSAVTSPRAGKGINRYETMGSARPTTSLGTDSGFDSDDDGLSDIEEMSPTSSSPISSPVHSCDPFIPKSVLITSSNGIPIPDPEPELGSGMIPAGVREDLQRRDWTVECYVKLLSTNLTGDLFNFQTMAGTKSRTVYRLALSNNIPRASCHLEGGTLKTVQANSLPTNEWIHLAAVWSHKKNSLGLYVNGLLHMSTPSVGESFSRFMFPATNSLAVAVSPNASFAGQLMLDEVRIWGVARSSEQIAAFASSLPPYRNGDDVWINTGSEQFYSHSDTIVVNGGSLFDGEPGTALPNVCQKDGNFWIDNGDLQYNAAIDVLLASDNTLKEGISGTLANNILWNDKDNDGAFSCSSLLAYYRFDDGGATAEDFARRAKSGLIGSTFEEFLFGDHGYALPTNGFSWVTTDTPPLYGTDKRGADDADGDGMPDAWEMCWHLDPWDDGSRGETSSGAKDGPGGPNGDPDKDGLRNLYEYWAGTNPQFADSDGDGIPDSQEDRDSDRVLNITEQQLQSRPDMADTDDDGSTDNEEQGSGSSPAEPNDPSVSRAITLGGNADDYLSVPLSSRQSLTDWTLEAWINPVNVTDGDGTILRRTVQTMSNETAMTYVMGLETNGSSLQLYAGYVWPDGRRFILKSGDIPAGGWTHVAARYNSLAAELKLYTNGGVSGTTNTFYDAPPVSGMGGETFLRIGEGFSGSLDEIRIWATVREDNEIQEGMSKVVPASELTSLAHYFRFDDGEAITNTFAFGEYHQPGGLQDYTFNTDWNQQWRHAARQHGSAAIVTPGAIVPPPSLRVILSPEQAKTAGAQWALDGGVWQDSGSTLQGLTSGEHTLIFKSVLGWLEPSSETIVLTNGLSTTLSRIYQQKASMTVSIEPLDVRATGQAAWRVDGGTWQESGSTVSNLNPGAHTLEFADVAGWVEPPLETVVLSAGQSLPITRVYSVMYGSVNTILSPTDAIADGAQWRIDNGTWMNSGDTIGNLSLTTHSVEFRAIPMWNTPASVSLTLTNENVVSLTGAYLRVTGLYVEIDPAEAISEGAMWQLSGGNWTNSGTFIELPAGTYEVAFTDLPDWLSPGSITATVSDQNLTTVVGRYYRMDTYGGEAGSGAGQFVGPRSVIIDSLHRMYVTDTGNNRIQWYDPLSRAWTIWGQWGTNVGQFITPSGITLTPSGDVYVADSGNHRIQIRRATNGQWQASGSYGTNVGSFIGPADIAVDSIGNIYVADLYNNRVQKRSTNGNWSAFITAGTTAGRVRNPRGLYVDALDNLYVSDDGIQTNGSSRIQKFDKSGSLLALLGSSLPSMGQLRRPAGMTMGSTNLYVADIENSKVCMSPTNGLWTTLLSSNVLQQAEDVAWDPRGFLCVADTGNNRILMLPAIPGVETNKVVSFSGVLNPGPSFSFTISWFAAFGWFYAIEYANTLGDPWQPLSGFSDIAGQDSVTNCTDYTIGSVTTRFYRVIAY